MHRLRVALFPLFVLLLAGCSVRSQVDVNVRPNGSGSVAVEVHMDKEAAAAVPDLEAQLRTADLVANGWSVDGPSKDASGDTVVKVHHGFGNIAQANVVLDSLGKNGGPFRDFRLTQVRSITNVRTAVTGQVDMTKGIESFGDDVLRARTGAPLGFDANELHNSLGVNYQTSFPVDVVVHIPGGNRTSAPATATDHIWHIQYGAVTTLTARANGWNVAVVFVCLMFASLLGVAAVVVFWKAYRPQHRGSILRASEGIRARDLLAEDGPPKASEAPTEAGTAEMSQSVNKVEE